MKRNMRSLSTCVALALSLGSTIATAGPAKTITLMQFSDLHGKMVPHQEIFQGERAQVNSGGLAKMATAIGQVRDDDPEALLLIPEEVRRSILLEVGTYLFQKRARELTDTEGTEDSGALGKREEGTTVWE